MKDKRVVELEKCLKKTLKDITDYAADSVSSYDCQDIPNTVMVRIKNRIQRVLKDGE